MTDVQREAWRVDSPYDLVKYSPQWRLPGYLRQHFKANEAFIADPSIARELAAQLKITGIRHMTPEQAREAMPEKIKRAMVWVKKGEKSLISFLRKQYPQIEFVSITYEFSILQQLGMFTYPQLKKRQPHALKAPITLLVSLPGSDAEYMAKVMGAAGLPKPVEFCVPAHVHYARWADDFDLWRLFYHAAHFAGNEKGLALHVQADVLFDLIDLGYLTLERLTQRLKKMQVRIIYLGRRDKLFQVGLLDAISHTPYRSPWLLPPHVKKNHHPEKMRFPYQTMLRLLDIESRLEGWLSSVRDKLKIVLIEDFLRQPKILLDELSVFLDQPIRPDAVLPPYSQLFEAFPWLTDEAKRLRRDIIDRLGLHVNQAGSWVTETDKLLR